MLLELDDWVMWLGWVMREMAYVLYSSISSATVGVRGRVTI